MVPSSNIVKEHGDYSPSSSSSGSSTLKNRLNFMEIDADTRKALDEYHPHLKAALPGIIAEFYEHISQWPNLNSMFKDQSRKDYAKNAQIHHWLALFEANFDGKYEESVRKIGLVHSRIGLEPTWYIGAYGFTLNRLYAHAVEQYQSRFSPDKAKEKTAKLLRALNQCVMIDMDMAITVYLEENEKTYADKLHKLAESFSGTVGSIVDGVSAASTVLEASAEGLASMATEASAGAQNVAAASEEASTNVSAVSSATEEMSASITHVADMAKKSYKSADQAAIETEKSVGVMVELKEAIDQINEVADLISDIAEQTNLLALNATIEAARAGEAGKGFAVVASEVKSLASETAKATEEIKAQVAEIVSKSNSASNSLISVKKVIDDSKAVAHETAEAVDQQKEAVKEIAGNVAQASAGTSEITSNINGISEGADGVSSAASGILDAAKELAVQGSALRDAVATFIADLEAGA